MPYRRAVTVPLLLIPPPNVSYPLMWIAACVPELPPAIVPALLTPPANVKTFVRTRPVRGAVIVPVLALTMPPEKVSILLRRTPFRPPARLPLFVIPPPNVLVETTASADLVVDATVPLFEMPPR